MHTSEHPQRIFLGSALHLHVTGALASSMVPWWVQWFRALHPQAVVNLSVSKAAEQFVSIRALRNLANGAVWRDDWDNPDLGTEWSSGRSGDSEAFIVFPASINTTMKLANAQTDSPALMMLQITDLPIIIADTFPGDSPALSHRVDLLSERENIQFAPRVTGYRAHNRETAEVGFNLPGCLEIVNEMLGLAK